MSWNVCKMPECESYTARPDGDYCESCRRANAKQETESKKQLEKRKSLLQKAQSKNLEPRKKINKVSDKMVSLNANYKILADEFKINNPSCVVRVNQYCTGKTESVHHKRGRGRYLLDVSTFLPCCLSCHGYIEAHPKEAKERGWSISRLQTTEPHKI